MVMGAEDSRQAQTAGFEKPEHAPGIARIHRDGGFTAREQIGVIVPEYGNADDRDTVIRELVFFGEMREAALIPQNVGFTDGAPLSAGNRPRPDHPTICDSNVSARGGKGQRI
jgi:hypothetical protein